MAAEIVVKRRGTGWPMVWAALLVFAGLIMILLPLEGTPAIVREHVEVNRSRMVKIK